MERRQGRKSSASVSSGGVKKRNLSYDFLFLIKLYFYVVCDD